MNPLRFGLVGAGRAGAVHARNIHGHAPDAQIVAVVDERAEQAEILATELAAKSYDSLAEATEGGLLDAVVIATPTHTHHELSIEAFEAGLHVFCEKPMALSAAECDEMIAAAERAGRVLQIGFVRRFQPEFVEAKARIDEGELGEVTLVKSLTRGPGLPPDWAHDLNLSNGMLAEVNSHCFDSVRWFADAEIARVYAEVANRKGAEAGVGVEDFYDNAIVSLRFTNGVLGAIDGVCPAEYGYDARVEIIGTKGLIAIGETEGMPVLTCVDRSRGGRRPTHKTWPERFSWGYVREIRAFIDAARGGAEVAATGLDGKAAVEAVVAANRSWREVRPVELAGVPL